MYDGNYREIVFYKSGYAYFSVWLESSSQVNLISSKALKLSASDAVVIVPGSSYFYTFYTTGTLQFPALGATAPTAHEADFCIETGSGDSENKCHFYDGDSQWNYLQDYNNW